MLNTAPRHLLLAQLFQNVVQTKLQEGNLIGEAIGCAVAEVGNIDQITYDVYAEPERVYFGLYVYFVKINTILEIKHNLPNLVYFNGAKLLKSPLTKKRKAELQAENGWVPTGFTTIMDGRKYRVFSVGASEIKPGTYFIMHGKEMYFIPTEAVKSAARQV